MVEQRLLSWVQNVQKSHNSVRHYRPKIQGFTLIEVLIASAIIAMSMGVLLQLFSGSIKRMHSATEFAHSLLIEQQLMQAITVLNPVNNKQGELVISGTKYHWQATLTQPFKVMPETQAEDKILRFAGLYEIKISEAGNNQATLFQWTQLGWK